MPKKIKAAEVKKMNDFMPILAKTESPFKKKADLAEMAAEQGNRVPLYWQDPLYDSQLIMFPEYNLPEANKRYRQYYKFNPILSFFLCIIFAAFALCILKRRTRYGLFTAWM